MKNMKKIAVLATSFALVAAIAVGGTMAYMTAKDDSITNSFTFGNIGIKLEETYTANSKVTPGAVISKTPQVTVKANSEESYVYMNIKTTLTSNEATLDVNTTNWTKLDTSTANSGDVYRYNTTVTPESAQDKTLEALFTKVSYSGANITEDNLETVANKTIIVGAYAHQATTDEAGVTMQEVSDDAAIAYFETAA